MNEFLYIVAGVGLFIGLSSLRRFQDGLPDSAYWLAFSAAGLALADAILPTYVFPILLPGLIRWQFLGWTGSGKNGIPIAGPVVSLAVVLLAFEFTRFGDLVLFGVVALQVTLSVRLIWSTYKRRGISPFGNSGKKVAWLQAFFLCNLLLILVLVVSQLDLLLMPGLTLVSYGLIAVLGIVHYSPEKRAFNILHQETKYVKSSLDPHEKFRITKAIEDEMEAGFHRNPDASLKNLATKIKTSTHSLSQAINEETGGTFFDLLALHRVRDARKLLKSPTYSNYKIEQIAEEVGYLSKSSFNTSFKKLTGYTPSEYRDRIVRDDKVERSTDREIATEINTLDTFGYLKISTAMLTNFLKLYIRNLRKNKVFSILNFSGLVIGFTSCLLIFLYVNDELSYDKFHERSEDIYRVYLHATNPQTRTPHPMAAAMVRDFPEVESAVSLTPLYGPGLTLQSLHIRNPENNITFLEPDAYAADSTFFDVFDFKLLAGDPQNALADVGSVVITESMAKRYFGDQDPLGKLLENMADGSQGVVTGVMMDPPRASHFHPRFIISYASLKSGNPDNPWFSWGDPGHFNYLKLRPGTDPSKIEAAIPKWINTVSTGVNPGMLEYLLNGTISYNLQPLESIHLGSNLKWELESNGSTMYIYILMGAIVFILIILSINYINLSTARTLERSREVGVRKVLGATQQSLSVQFIFESVATCLSAMVFAFVLSLLFLDPFNNLTGKVFLPPEMMDQNLILYSLALVVVIGFISGIFPSLALSAVRSIEVLKGGLLKQRKNDWKKMTLVGVQFAVSAVMIFGSLIILKQVKFIESKSMGFDEEALVVLKLQRADLRPSAEAMKSELLKDPTIIAVGGLSNLPGEQFNQNDLFLEETPTERVPSSELWVDYDGLQALGLSLNVGRFFEASYGLDSAGANYIINQIAAEQLQLGEPVGTKVMWDANSGPREGTIVGVVDNFNYKSLHEPIKPLLVMVGLNSFSNLLIRVNASDITRTVDHISRVYESFDDRFAADITFLDDRLDNLYHAERKAFDLFNLFSTIALILAAMGLLGLAYLVVTQRTKEIGIRKVLGARLIEILWMENKAFLRVVAVSVVLGLPLGTFIMQRWLDEFAYKTEIGTTPLLITTLAVVLVCIASVSIATLRTALRNPSDALRYE